MIGYTRAEPPVWMQWLPVRVRGHGQGRSDRCSWPARPTSSIPTIPTPRSRAARAPGGGRIGGGWKKLSETKLDSPPVFDGLIAARGRLFVSLEDGSVVCLAGSSGTHK